MEDPTDEAHERKMLRYTKMKTDRAVRLKSSSPPSRDWLPLLHRNIYHQTPQRPEDTRLGLLSAAVDGCRKGGKTAAGLREAMDTHPGLISLWWASLSGRCVLSTMRSIMLGSCALNIEYENTLISWLLNGAV